MGRVWAACTADVSLRVVDLEIKKLIANIWIRENDNVKLSQIKTILKTEVGVTCLIMVINGSFIYKQTVK